MEEFLEPYIHQAAQVDPATLAATIFFTDH